MKGEILIEFVPIAVFEHFLLWTVFYFLVLCSSSFNHEDTILMLVIIVVWCYCHLLLLWKAVNISPSHIMVKTSQSGSSIMALLPLNIVRQTFVFLLHACQSNGFNQVFDYACSRKYHTHKRDAGGRASTTKKKYG